jgi:hypothetical protein
MSRNHRIVIQLLGPPFIATIITAMIAGAADSLIYRLAGFPVLLAFSYLYGIVPSAIYTAIMELWFENGYCSKYGLTITVALSGVLGLGAGFFVELLSHPLTQSGWITCLLPVGFIAGVIVGFYVGRKQPSTNPA